MWVLSATDTDCMHVMYVYSAKYHYWYNFKYISMALCKPVVTLLLTHWSFCSLALSHRYVVCKKHSVCVWCIDFHDAQIAWQSAGHTFSYEKTQWLCQDFTKAAGFPLCPHYTPVTLFTMHPRSQKYAGVHRSYLDLNWSAKIQVFYALFRMYVRPDYALYASVPIYIWSLLRFPVI